MVTSVRGLAWMFCIIVAGLRDKNGSETALSTQSQIEPIVLLYKDLVVEDKFSELLKKKKKKKEPTGAFVCFFFFPFLVHWHTFWD